MHLKVDIHHKEDTHLREVILHKEETCIPLNLRVLLIPTLVILHNNPLILLNLLAILTNNPGIPLSQCLECNQGIRVMELHLIHKQEVYLMD